MGEIANVLPVTSPADTVSGPAQGRWTYDDYARIAADGHRYEVIEGVLYMTPAPSPRHQAAVIRVGSLLFQ